jgi:hypothetical protein
MVINSVEWFTANYNSKRQDENHIHGSSRRGATRHLVPGVRHSGQDASGWKSSAAESHGHEETSLVLPIFSASRS